MRIALDCRCAFQGMGGIGRYAWSLLTEYLEIAPQHEFVCLLTHLPQPEALPLRPRLTVRVFEAGMIDERFDQFILPTVLEEEGIDLYHNPTFAVPTIRGRAKLLSTVHDVVFARRPELVEPRLREYLDAATRRACRLAELVITVSEFSKSEILASYPVAAERVRVIPNGVHAPRANAVDSGEAALKNWKLKRGQYLLYVGSIEKKKNIRMLLEAFGQVRRRAEHRAVQLVLAGSVTRGDPELETVLQVSTQGGGVVLAGHVSDQALENLYSNASVFVYPSLYEGFGLPPLEAMLRGVPTIVAGSSCLPEVVGDGARIVSPNSVDDLEAAMRDLLSDHDLRSELIERGRRRAMEFTWRRSAEAHLALYEEVLGLRRSDSAPGRS